MLMKIPTIDKMIPAVAAPFLSDDSPNAPRMIPAIAHGTEIMGNNKPNTKEITPKTNAAVALPSF